MCIKYVQCVFFGITIHYTELLRSILPMADLFALFKFH